MRNNMTEEELLRMVAEARLARGTPLENEDAAHAAGELLYELQVHQIELEMQNETLRQTQLALEESRDRYLDLYDFAPLGYLTLTSKALITEANLTAATMLGVERGKLLQRRFTRFVSAGEGDRWYLHFLRLVQHEERLCYEGVLQRADGSRFTAQLDCLRQERAGEEPTVRIALTDISARKRIEEELRIVAVAFESQEGVIVTDPNGMILRVNQAFTRLTGYSAEEALGQTPALLRSGRHDKQFYQRLWQTLKEQGHWQGEIWNRRKNGKIYAELLSITAVHAPDGAVTHYVGLFSEIARDREAEAEIHRLAYYDPLTQLPNRRLFQERLKQALAASGRNGLYGAILFLDLDRFKELNDLYGHDAGDHLLIEVARRLSACVRADDTVARLAGDEFVLLLEGLDQGQAEAATRARQLGDKVQEAMARPFLLTSGDYHCTTSIGICLFPNNEATVEELLHNADLAMYQSKSAGRNTLRFFDPAMQLMQDQRNALFHELREAGSRGELQLYYQPQVTQQEGGSHITGAEALLRWNHPRRGILLPEAFMPLAEESGLSLDIGRWVVASACARLKAWAADEVTRGLRLAINLSTRQCQTNLIEALQQELAQSGIDPGRLTLELSENLLLDALPTTLEAMRTLRAQGIRFALDNFGTGYSSISQLAHLPLDQLKIDRELIHHLPEDHNSALIVRTIITIGNNFGLELIAEGVEREEQRTFLRDHGCLACQGELTGPPLPLEEFERLLRPQG
ncbi:MAG: EAL domain-containing protein [Gammaproteobacteria bacterium]|nr:EAL domain-containing protein [Gammaproteobacteria bacterium]